MPLAKLVAAYELDVAVVDVDRHWRRVYSALVQTHLSTVSQAALVEYDIEQKTIAPVEKTAPIAAWVRALNVACASDDDFAPVRCDAREGDLVVLDG